MGNCKKFFLGLPLFLLIIYFYGTKIQTDGLIINNKNYGNIEIRRDEYGIPHIKAANRLDSLFGLGFSMS